MADPVLTRHIGDLWPELTDLFATGEQVVALAESPGWGHVLAVLDAEVATIDARLDGQLKPLEQAEYALAHGRRDGLRAARRTVDAIIRRYHEQLEEQQQTHEDGGESSSGRS